MQVESRKENNVEEGLYGVVDEEKFGIPLLEENKVEPVTAEKGKLENLQKGYVALPPEVTLHSGPHCCQTVVAVHENVQEGVEKHKESAAVKLTTQAHTDPTKEGHTKGRRERTIIGVLGYLI